MDTNLVSIIQELEVLGTPRLKKNYSNQGAHEPLFVLKIAALLIIKAAISFNLPFTLVCIYFLMSTSNILMLFLQYTEGYKQRYQNLNN